MEWNKLLRHNKIMNLSDIRRIEFGDILRKYENFNRREISIKKPAIINFPRYYDH